MTVQRLRKTEALAELAEAKLLTAPKILDGSGSVGAATRKDAAWDSPAVVASGRAPASDPTQPGPLQIESPSERFRRVSWEWFVKGKAA